MFSCTLTSFNPTGNKPQLVFFQLFTHTHTHTHTHIVYTQRHVKSVLPLPTPPLQTAQLIVTLWLQQNIRLLLNYIPTGCGQQPGGYRRPRCSVSPTTDGRTDGRRPGPGKDWRLVLSLQYFFFSQEFIVFGQRWKKCPE